MTYENIRNISMVNEMLHNVSMAYGNISEAQEAFQNISKNKYEIEAQTSYSSIVHVRFNSVVAPRRDEFSTPSTGSHFLLEPSYPTQVLGRL